MATFKITTPDGSSYNVTAPDSASQDDVMAYAQQQHASSAQSPTTPPQSNDASPHFGSSLPGRFLQGMIVNPVIAGGQALVNAVPTVADALGAHGYASDVRSKAANMNAGIKDYFNEYEKDRAGPPSTSDLVSGKQPDPGFDFAQLAGSIASPINRLIPVGGSSSLLPIAGKAAAQGALSGFLTPTTNTDNLLASKVAQTATGGAAGAVGGVLASKLADAVSGVVGKLQSSLPGASAKAAAGADDAINQAAAASGMDLSQIPKSMLDQVRQQTQQALATGNKFDTAAALRQTEGNMVLPKAPLTLGQTTRDPQQYANEVNLRGVNGPGQPLAERFAGQNSGLIDALNSQGASRAPGEFSTGNMLINGLKASDAQTQQGVSSRYDAAKSMNGAEIPIDHRAFADTALQGLDASMKGAFLPKEIKGILNDISSGKTPLNVTVAEQLKTILGNASASAKDGNAREAIGIVRKALDNAPPLTNDGGVLSAFGAARNAAKSRFDGLDANPAMKSAINGAQPDDFFHNQVINGDVSGVNHLVQSLNAAPSPNPLAAQLTQAASNAPRLSGPASASSGAGSGVTSATSSAVSTARDQVVAYLKGKALNGGTDETGAFSQSAYNKALASIGPDKLATMFSPAEVETLNRIGRVAAYTMAAPRGSAVNTSNTAASVMNFLSGLAGSAGKLPGLNIATKSFKDFQQSQVAKNALAAKLQAEPVEGDTNLLRSLLAPAAGTFGTLGAQLLR